MNNPLTASERLAYSTVRLECQQPNGLFSIGTGFIFAFKAENDRSIPILLTNKHVIEGSITGRIQLTKADKEGNPIIGNFENVIINDFNKIWIMHPDKDVDLCALILGPFLNHEKEKGKEYFIQFIGEDLLPNDALKNELSALEEIIMIGYPIGIWDSKNNLPLFRRGITATHPNINYEGKCEFVIDCACFPGSSGSPIFLYNTGTYSVRRGGTAIGTRISLLGILYAGPQITVEGNITVVPIPTNYEKNVVTRIPINLGYVIKSERILEFRSQIIR